MMNTNYRDTISEMGYSGLNEAEDIGNVQQEDTDLPSAYRYVAGYISFKRDEQS